MKKRDAKGYAKFLKEQQEKKQKNKSTNNKEKNSSEIVKTKKHVSNLTDNELRKLNDRIRLENDYNRLIREYNQNKRTATNTIKKMSKTVLEPALIGASKNVVQDLLTRIGKTTNIEINNMYKNSINDAKKNTNNKNQTNQNINKKYIKKATTLKTGTYKLKEEDIQNEIKRILKYLD